MTIHPPSGHRGRRRAGSVALGAAVVLALGACGSGDGGRAGTPTDVGTPTAVGTPSPAVPAVTPSPALRPAGVTDPRTVPEPVAVSAPSIGLSSGPLQALGVAADGKAEVPEDYDRVGWFTGGGRPGARGPTVVMGHVDSKSGPAAFYDLRDLGRGDVVEVTVAGGEVARYAVTEIENFPKDAFPTAAVFGATTVDTLRLVTCAGEFDRGARSYTDNLVVSAERLS